MKKPTKAWQFGLDLIITEKGSIHLLEINNASSFVLPFKSGVSNIFYDENIEGIQNYEWSRDLYIRYLLKYLNKIDIRKIHLKYILGHDFLREDVKNSLNKNGIIEGWGGFPIFAEIDAVTKENTGWFSKDKTTILKDKEKFKEAGIEPKRKTAEFDESSSFPNFVLKPRYGARGRGIVFYKQKGIVEIKDYITEEFLLAKPATESLNFINGKLEKITHPPRLCDYRAKLIIDDVGNVFYMGTHRRTSCKDIPERLETGKISIGHSEYHTYLCNGAWKRTLLLEEDQNFWEEVTLKVGKKMYEIYLKNEKI